MFPLLLSHMIIIVTVEVTDLLSHMIIIVTVEVTDLLSHMIIIVIVEVTDHSLQLLVWSGCFNPDCAGLLY